MNVYALIPLLSVAAYAALMAVALRNPRRRERRAFALYLTAAGVWSLVSFLLHLDYSFLLQYTLPATRVLLVVFIWMVVTYYSFVRVFVYRPAGPGLYASVACVFLVAAMAGTGLLPRDAYAAGGVLFIDYGPSFYVLGALGLALGTASAVLLVHHWRRLTNPLARTPVNYLLVGLGIVALASLTNLSRTLSQYPIDQVGNLANAAIISYAVMRHRLLDIRFVIRRGVAYFGLTVVVTTAYLLALYLVQRFFPVRTTYPNLLVAAGLALVMAVLFSPLRHLAQERVDRIFFRNTYHYRRVLRDFSQGMVSTLDLEELAQGMLEPLLNCLRARWAALLMPQPETGDFRAQFSRSHGTGDKLDDLILRKDNPFVGRLARDGEVLRAELFDVVPEGKGLWESERSSLQAYAVELLCPILRRGELAGILALGPRERGGPYNHEEIELLATMGSGVAVALDNARMMAALAHHQTRHEKLLARVVTAQEEERRRVAAELHDSVAQWLVRASYQAQICSALLGTQDNNGARAELTDMEKTIDSCIVELRRVLGALRPPALEELGLAHAVRQELQSLEAAGVSCFLGVEGVPDRLSSTTEITAYRIVQEALNNVRKHARASQVQVRLRFREKDLSIEVADNGRGFDLHRTLESAVSAGHMGLLGMRERAAQVGGTLKMYSSPGAGTRLELRLPVAARQDVPEEVTWDSSA